MRPITCLCPPFAGYAVLVVLSVVVIMGAGVCYRTRVYQRRMYALAGGFQPRHALAPSAAPDWGPKPTLFDVHLRETPPVEWDAIMARVLCFWDPSAPANQAPASACSRYPSRGVISTPPAPRRSRAYPY